MKVLFIGSNPSVKAKTYNPFCTSTKSGQILNRWVMATCYGKFVSYANVSDYTTHSNKPLSIKEIKESLPRLQEKINAISPCRIVALGKAAEKALTLLQLPFFPMEHPSGRNFKLNNKEYIAIKIEQLKQYIQT